MNLSSISDRKFIFFVIIVYMAVSFSLLLKWPPPWPDEVHFADAARTLSEQFRLGTNLIKGMEAHVYWQPPLYFAVLAIVIKLGCFNLLVVRMFSLIIGSLDLVFLYKFARKVTNDRLAAMLCVTLLALNPNFVNYIKLARMDGLCLLFTLTAICFYLDALPQWRDSKFFLVGLFLALAAFSHPLGLIGVVSVCLHFLLAVCRNQVGFSRKLLLLLIPLIVGSLLWGLYILQDPQNFSMQMHYQFERKSLTPLLSVMNFLERYRSIPLFLLLFFIALINDTRRYFKEPHQAQALLLILCYVSILIVGIKFELVYHSYFLPYASLAVSVFLIRFLRSNGRRGVLFSSTMIVLLVLNFLLYFIYFNIVLHLRLAKDTDYSAFESVISSRLPAHSAVLLYGYPSAFWGLHAAGKDFRMVEGVFLGHEQALQAVGSVDYVVMTRSFDPTNDSVEFVGQLTQLRKTLAECGKTLRLVNEVGVKKRYAYSAEIFSVESKSVDNLATGDTRRLDRSKVGEEP